MTKPELEKKVNKLFAEKDALEKQVEEHLITIQNRDIEIQGYRDARIGYVTITETYYNKMQSFEDELKQSKEKQIEKDILVFKQSDSINKLIDKLP